MGGGYYDRDIGITDDFDSQSAYTNYADSIMSRRSSIDPSLLPRDRRLVCNSANPIVIAMDVTGSMGNWSKVIYDKMPMIYGQIILQGYLSDPAISFAAVGDAYSDYAPIQICDFAQGDELDNWLTRLWLEGNGGGQVRESYTLTAYAYLELCSFGKLSGKPFFFFTGDESFYETLEAEQIQRYLGKVSGSVSSETILKELMRKFHVFMIHKPYSSGEDAAIVQKWRNAIGEDRVLILHDPKAVGDTILGAIAIAGGSRTLDTYILDMENREQTAERIGEVSTALTKLNQSQSLVSTNDTSMLPAPTGKHRSSRTKRLEDLS